MVKQNLNIDKKELALLSRKKIVAPIKKRVMKEVSKKIPNEQVQSLVGHLNAFSENAKSVAGLSNNLPSVKYTSKGKVTFTASATLDVLVAIGPTGYSDSPALSAIADSNLAFSNGTNVANGWMAAASSRIGCDVVVASSTNASTTLFPGYTTTTAYDFPSYCDMNVGFVAEAQKREVSFGVRLQNRTATLNRVPVIYVFHDLHHELIRKRWNEPTMTIQQAHDFILGHQACITWDCIKDPVFELSIIPFKTNGTVSNAFTRFPRDGDDNFAFYGAINTFSVDESGDAGPLPFGAVSAYDSANNRYNITAPKLTSPNVYVIVPAAAVAQSIEITGVAHNEYRSSDLERLGLCTLSHPNRQVEDIISQVKREKHHTMGRSLIHAIKPAVKSAVTKIARNTTDKNALATVTAAAMLL